MPHLLIERAHDQATVNQYLTGIGLGCTSENVHLAITLNSLETEMKSNNWGFCVPVALALLLLSGCAHRDNALRNVDYQKFASEPVSSMRFFVRLYSWQAIDDERLIVQTKPKQGYLLTLFSPCFDLDFQHSIGLSSFGNTVSAGFDRVLLANKQSCRIKTIQPIDIKELNQARKLAVSSTQKNNG